MNWQPFHFKCRYFLQKVNEGLTLQQASKAFETSDAATLYSTEDLTGIQKELFDKVLLCSNIDDTKKTLKTFSVINFAENFSSSETYETIKNKLSYLEAITVIFIMFISIYKLYVFPVFAEMFQQHPTLENEYFHLTPSIWLLSLTVALLAFMFTFSYRKYIKNIDVLVINLPSKILRAFIPKKVMVEISKLNEIITIPLNLKGSDNDFSKKMATITAMGLDESTELNYLFKYQAEKLKSVVWQHSKQVLSTLSALVTIGVAFYIFQIYDTIFKLGAIVE